MLAVPEFRGRVAPVFDTCRTLWVFESHGENEDNGILRPWEGIPRGSRPKALKDLGVEILLCGGISGWMMRQVEMQGIQVFPWLSGEIREVVNAFRKGEITDTRYAMPGCCGLRRRHRKVWNHGKSEASWRSAGRCAQWRRLEDSKRDSESP